MTRLVAAEYATTFVAVRVSSHFERLPASVHCVVVRVEVQHAGETKAEDRTRGASASGCDDRRQHPTTDCGRRHRRRDGRTGRKWTCVRARNRCCACRLRQWRGAPQAEPPCASGQRDRARWRHRRPEQGTTGVPGRPCCQREFGAFPARRRAGRSLRCGALPGAARQPGTSGCGPAIRSFIEHDLILHGHLDAGGAAGAWHFAPQGLPSGAASARRPARRRGHARAHRRGSRGHAARVRA